MRLKEIRRLLVIGFAILLLVPSCKEPDLDLQNPVMTTENEHDLGERLYEISMGSLPVLAPEMYPVLYSYIDQVMDMVTIASEMKTKFNWDILVYEDDVNQKVFILPGGKMFISTGMLITLESEHQLVALLAHEVYFADRPDQNDKGDLSLVMQYLKEEFGAYGTRTFLDVIDMVSDQGDEMVEYVKNLSYEPYQVFHADDFAMNTLCNNYLYSPYGIQEILLIGNENSNFLWLDNRPPGRESQMVDTGYDLQSRMANLEMWYDGCGNENSDMYTNRYNDIVNVLR